MGLWWKEQRDPSNHLKRWLFHRTEVSPDITSEDDIFTASLRAAQKMETIWAPVVSPAEVPQNKIPSSRCKHATVLHGQYLYLLGGRNSNIPLKDFWRYCIGENAMLVFKICKF